MAVTSKKPDPSQRNAYIQSMQATWNLVRALMGGTEAMRNAGKAYLPQWPNEQQHSYDARIATATLFPAYSHTMSVLIGKPFAKPLIYGDNVPAKIKQWCEDDADLQGRNFDAFAASVGKTALAYGLAGIFVDFPQVQPGAIRSLAEERAAGVRPYMVEVMPWNILAWRSVQVMGVETLTQLRLMETVMVPDPDDPFADLVIEQVRVLEVGADERGKARVNFAIWREEKDAKGDKAWAEKPELGGTMSIGFIPFVPVYGERTGFMKGRPPLLEMAHMNAKHWQSQSDQDTILHVTRVPILAVSGINDTTWELTIGASTATKLPTGAQMVWVEHSGAAIGAGKVSLDDLKDEMRQAGAELLVLRPGRVTATEVQSENAVMLCALNEMVAAMEDALDLTLKYMAAWVNEADGGNVQVFNDFGAATLSDAQAQLLLSARAAGEIDKKTFLTELKRRGILSPDVDVDAVIAQAETEGPDLALPTDNSGTSQNKSA